MTRKTVAVSQSHLIRRSYISATDLLLESTDIIEEALDTQNISKTSQLGILLLEAVDLIKRAQNELSIPDRLRSRTSSNTSTGSLGDRIAIHDKETFLYTYKWTSRNSDVNSWRHGNHFKDWVEEPYRRLPVANSELNCWEAVITLLFMYHAITKSDIHDAYSKYANEGDDASALNKLFGIDNDGTQVIPTEALRGFVKTGDILFFHSNRGDEFGHVALVLDNFEKLWVASHWSLPKGKMIRLTPNRIFETSKASALEAFSAEVTLYARIVSKLQEKVSDLLQLDSTEKHRLIKSNNTANRSLNEVSQLLESAKKKHSQVYQEVTDYKSHSDEYQILSPLLEQGNALLTTFQNSLEKFSENESALGILYDYIDSFEQKELLNPLEKLEYLVSDSVLISTKFRPYFQD